MSQNVCFVMNTDYQLTMINACFWLALALFGEFRERQLWAVLRRLFRIYTNESFLWPVRLKANLQIISVTSESPWLCVFLFDLKCLEHFIGPVDGFDVDIGEVVGGEIDKANVYPVGGFLCQGAVKGFAKFAFAVE